MTNLRKARVASITPIKPIKHARLVAGGLVIVLLYGQRLEIPNSNIPIVLPALLLSVLWFWVSKSARLSIVRLLSLAGIVLGAGIAVLISASTQYSSVAPFVFGIAGWGTVAVVGTDRLSQIDVRKLLVFASLPLAFVAIAQFIGQLLRVPFQDWVALLPREWLVDGYVTRAAWSLPGLASPIIRANAMVFLEPSFAGQYFALAAMAAIGLHRRWALPVFVAATLVTGSGTGLLALIAGAVGFFISAGGRARIAGLSSILVALVALRITALDDVFWGRTAEFSENGTSGSQRFVEPWMHVLRFFGDFDQYTLVGLGPGNTGITAALYDPGVNYTFSPQLIIEYGLPIAVIATCALIVAMLRNRQPLAVKFTLIAMVFFLSGTLYQASTMATVWILCCLPSPESDSLEAESAT